MPRVIADRVRETSATTGTGALTLAGAVAGGWRTWASALAVGDTAPAVIVNAANGEWEVTEVTLLANGTLARAAPYASSNAGASVNFAAGTKDVLLGLSAADMAPMILAQQGFHAADLVQSRGAPIIAGGWGPALWGAQPAFARGAAVSRASAGTAFVDGVLTEYAAGAARWGDWQGGVNGARALLLGGQRTNLVPNPRFEGAVAFTGTPPVITPVVAGGAITGYTITNPGAGLVAGQVSLRLNATVGTVPAAPTVTISGGQVTAVSGGTGGSGLTGSVVVLALCGVPPTGLSWPRNINSVALTAACVAGTGVDNGIPYVDWRLVATATGVFDWELVSLSGFAPGDVSAFSLYARIVGGTLLSNMSAVTYDLPTFAVSTSGALPVPVGGTLGAFRPTAIRASAAGTTGLSCRVTFAATGPFDVVIRFGAPQVERATFAAAVILPPPGTLAASTRLADALPALAVAGPATVLLEGVLPNLPTSADGNMMLAQFDAGTDADRIRVHVAAGGTQIIAGRVVGGVVTDATALGTVTAGGRFAVALRHDGAGTLGGVMTGGAVQTLGGALAAPSALLLGNNRAGTSPLFGLIRQARLFPRALSDAEMLAAVA